MTEYKIKVTTSAKKDMRETHAYIANNLQAPDTAVFIVRVLYARRDWMNML
jgi:plasmid stabilization system protein ParE